MAGSKTLVIACGALARELLDIVKVNRLEHMTIECLPASLHNYPKQIPDAVRARIRRARPHYDTVFVGYADCGTGGLLDAVIEEEGVERLAGAHCYEFFAGAGRFAAMHTAEPGTFYLTDYLVRHFDRLIMAGLGLDRHPELRDAYFGNYTRVVHLAQVDDTTLREEAKAAADKLGLTFEHQLVGYGDLEPAINQVAIGGLAATST